MSVIQEFFQLDIPSLIMCIFIIMSALIAIVEIIGKFSNIIGKPVSWIQKKDEDHLLLLQTANDLKAITGKYEESVRQSIIHDNRIKDSVMTLSEKVDILADAIQKMKEIQDKDKLSEYKDRIGQSYRYYSERKYSDANPIPYWNNMERDTMRGLIEQYEAHGGKNSFVHTVVEPEMQKWKIID